MKKLFLYWLVLTAVIIAAARMMLPASYEFSVIRPASCYYGSCEAETVVSWNFSGRPAAHNVTSNVDGVEKYFSIEIYFDGDINDSFYIGSIHKHYKQPYTGAVLDWTVFYIESYKNVDDAWMNIEFSL